MMLFDVKETRVCKQCKTRKPLEDFYPRKEREGWYKHKCKECVRANSKDWRTENPERHRENTIKWAANNRDKANLSVKNWMLANFDRFITKNKARRATKANATPKWLNRGHWVEIEGYNLWCRIFPGHNIDHIYPIKNKSVVGLHVPWNLQILTETENKRKNNKMPDPATIAPYIERPTLKIDADGFASLEFSDD